MQFLPEVHASEFESIFQRFLAITGAAPWLRRIDWLGKQIQQNRFMRGYLIRVHPLEMGFAELRHERAVKGRIDTAQINADRYRLFAFMTATVMIHERLGARGQNRLRGMLLGGLKDKSGLTPLEQELAVAIHLFAQRFQVAFSDLEGAGGGFDYLAHRDGVELEVECKRVGYDLGRQVPTWEIYHLHNWLQREVQPTFTGLRCGLFLRVTLPSRLSARHEQVRGIAGIVGRTFRTGVGVQDDLCQTELQDFQIRGSPFAKSPDAPDFESLVRDFIEKRFACRNRELFMLASPKRRALVIAIESSEPDTLLDNMFDELSDSTNSQFTKTRPGLLCVQFLGLTNEQVKQLGTQSDGTGRPSALLEKTSKFLSDPKRSHIVAIAFRGIGAVSKISTVAGNVRTSVVSESGNAFVIRNNTHPLSGDSRYVVFPSEQERQILVIRESRIPRWRRPS